MVTIMDAATAAMTGNGMPASGSSLLRGSWRAAPHQHIDMVYELHPVRGQATPQAREVTGCAWVPLDKVAGLSTPPRLPARIERAAGCARAVRRLQEVPGA